MSKEDQQNIRRMMIGAEMTYGDVIDSIANETNAFVTNSKVEETLKNMTDFLADIDEVDLEVTEATVVSNF